MLVTIRQFNLLKICVLIAFTILAFALSSSAMYLTFRATSWAGNFASNLASLSVWIASFAACSQGLWRLTLKLSSTVNCKHSR